MKIIIIIIITMCEHIHRLARTLLNLHNAMKVATYHKQQRASKLQTLVTHPLVSFPKGIPL